MTDKNYVTAVELQDTALVAQALNDLSDRLRTRNASVSIGEVRLVDSNGDTLGYLTEPNLGSFAFTEKVPTYE